jgi:hypothetical protein
MPLSAFLDYPVIDHLLRIDEGRYAGKHQQALAQLRLFARDQKLRLWMSEIARVEMAHGQQNPRLTNKQRTRALENDTRKAAIAADLGVRWLAYPCAKMDDEYSLLDLSFRFGGREWEDADALERELVQLTGVSKGDARHIVSWVFGWEDDTAEPKPNITWFVSEDELLRNALAGYQSRATHALLRTSVIACVAELVDLVRQQPG